MKYSNKLLVPIDFNEQSLFALNYACGVAKALKQKIMLLYVHEESGFFSKMFSTEVDETPMLEKMKNKLEEIAKKSAQKFDIQVEPFFVKGSVTTKIVEMSEILEVDMILMGISNALKTENYPIGANTHRVVRAAKVPVLTIRNPKEYLGIRAILLPIDLSIESRYKVNQAIRIAKITGAKIHAISGYWDKNVPEVEWKLKTQLKQVERFVEGFDIKIQTAFIKSDETTGKDLVALSLNYLKNNPDIGLAMVTQSDRDITDFFMDSETQNFIRYSPIPVMSVRSKMAGVNRLR